MTRQQSLDLVRHLLFAARGRDRDAVEALYAEDAVAVSPLFGEVRGAAAIADAWSRLFAGLEDVSTEVSHMLADGDRVAVLSTVSGTDRLGWFGLAPTGGPISYKLVLLFTIADGKIVRDERIYDSGGLLERLEKARIDKELRTAAEVQRMLLSRTATVNAFSESLANSVPCRAIGGDFFEIVEWQSGNVGLAMGDVAGKGPAAALLASMVQGMLSVEARAGDGPAAALTRINMGLVDRHLGARFATMVYAVLSPDGTLTYANAGHNPPALVNDHGIERLTAGGPILGAFGNARFDEAMLRLAADDVLVMFTDGATESLNRRGEEFGDERLIASVLRHASAPTSDILSGVFAAVREFSDGLEPADDITVTVTKFLGV